MKKILSLLVVLTMIVSLFSGCCIGSDTVEDIRLFGEIIAEMIDAMMDEEEPWDNPFPGQGSLGPTPRPEDIEILTYTLDQAMIDAFYELLEYTEQVFTTSTDTEEIDELSDELDDAYLALIDQSNIAYILYCLEQSNETLSQQYLDSMDVCTLAEEKYNDMARRVYLSDAPAKDHIFEDWTPQEINQMMLRNEEITQLEKRNTEITLEYRELDDATMQDDMIPLYNELVRNNNRIAQIYGYDNYYTYAYEMVYDRDYTAKELQVMRDYVSQYLIPTQNGLINTFYSTYPFLDADQSEQVRYWVYQSYDEEGKQYVEDYFDTLPESAREWMEHMFREERVVFTESSDAYEGAFTDSIGDLPYCYFGPGYINASTVIHEVGHYYAACNESLWEYPLDLAETHSQGNEWLYIHYLKTVVDPEVYDCLLTYQLLTQVGNVISFTAIDEFEQRLYSHKNAGNLTRDEYEALMEDVAESYGGIDFIEDSIMDIQLYWKYVVIEQPVYYISYAVSGLAAVSLYTMAQEDESGAHQAYVNICEDADTDQGFLWNLQHAGLAGPFDKDVYTYLYNAYAN